MMSTNSFSSSSPSYSARQQNSQYSPYVSPSVRQQGQRFNYHAPSPYPRPRSSASKPNPSLSGDNYHLADSANDYYYMSEQPYNNNNYGSNANDKSSRFTSNYNNDYGSPSSEYYSCNDDSFRSPLSSVSPLGNYQSSGFTGTSSQQYSSYFNAGFSGSPNKQPVNFQGSGYTGTPVQQQQKRRGFGQRRFSQGRNGVSTAQKRGASAGFPYQGSGLDGNMVQNSPAKKPRVSVRCEICNIEFTSDIPYKMHLVGAKHLKKVKSKEVLITMESQGQALQSKDNYFYCEHCQVMANSSQQLQMHFDGIKHKNKMRKLAEGEDGTKQEATPKSDGTEKQKNKVRKLAENEDGTKQDATLKNNGAKQENKMQKLAENGSKQEATPKNDVNSVPDETGPKPAKMTKFYCDVCSLALNSEIQLSQHVTSKRHEAKVKGEPFPPKKKPRKFTDEPTSGNETSDTAAPSSGTINNTEKSGTTHKAYGVQELGSSFVSGGVLQ